MSYALFIVRLVGYAKIIKKCEIPNFNSRISLFNNDISCLDATILHGYHLVLHIPVML